MRKVVLSSILVFGTFISSYSQPYSKLISMANNLYIEGNYSVAKEKYKQAFLLKNNIPDDLYNGACSAILSNDIKLGIAMLENAVSNGWTNVQLMKVDEDLRLLHGTKKFEELISLTQINLDKLESQYNEPLQAKLLALLEDDQEIRRIYIRTGKSLGPGHPKADSIKKIMAYKDSVNSIKLIEILNFHGWVGEDIVGEKANSTYFLIIQHSDLKTQQKYLPVMREAVKNANAKSSSLALLEDRVALKEGKRQIYGSQIGKNKETNEYYIIPLEDPDSVDIRREKMSLGELKDYVSFWGIRWDIENYKEKLPIYEEWYFDKTPTNK